MKLSTTPRIVVDPILTQVLRDVAVQINQLSEGRIAARYTAQSSTPTTGTYQQGDFVTNSAPTELGTTPNKYVIEGWLCVASGTPGTFVQKRFLTGN